MGIIDNTANNGVISATLISNIASTVNDMYDFCVDLGLNQSAARGLYTRRDTDGTIVRGADETRFFSGTYTKTVNATGLVWTGNIAFGSIFDKPPHVMITPVITPGKGYLFACVSDITKTGCKIYVYNPTTTKYNGNVTVNLLAIGVEASGR